MKRTEIKSLFISPGRMDFFINLYTEAVPRRVVLGLVKHIDAQDTSRRNPFNFVHGNVRSISLSACGSNYPHVPYQINYAQGDYARVYHDFNSALGFSFTNGANTISKEMYKNGFAIYVFNTTTTLLNMECADLIRRGPTALHIQFDSPVPAGGFSLIALSEHDSLLIIDQNRQVSTDLTP